MFRFRPSIEFLETRENPSDPGLVGPMGVPIDPNTGLPYPAQTTPPAPDPTVPVDPGMLIPH